MTGSPQVAKLSVSGIGMRSHTDVAIRMFRSLADAGINVDMINTSEVRVNVVVAGPQGKTGAGGVAASLRRCAAVGRLARAGAGDGGIDQTPLGW